MGLGHAVRLIPSAYVKAYVRRNKTDAADAEAICEALGRKGMRPGGPPDHNVLETEPSLTGGFFETKPPGAG